MSRWFRHYAGMMRDEKLVRIALRTQQPIERVVWIWGAILESAAEINDDGRYDFDLEEAAHFLRVDVTVCNVVVTELVTRGHVTGDKISAWNKRQYKSDDSSERVRKHRAKNKTETNQIDIKCVTDRYSNVNETLRNGPETETETDKKKDAAPKARTPVPPVSSEEADLFRRGKEILGNNSGGLIKKLLAAKDGRIPLARAALEVAATKHDPREYIGAVINNRDGAAALRARGEAW